MDDDLILGGDQLLPGISANIGVYPTEPLADPLGDWLDSTRALQPFARDDQLGACPAINCPLPACRFG